MSRLDERQVKRAAEVLGNGGIVVYPTETVYGIGCDPLNREAYSRILRLKGRDESRPMLLLACSVAQVEEFAGGLPDVVSRLADVFWPGPLTMVFRPEKRLPDYLYGPGDGVAFRVSPHPLASLLAFEFGAPVVSTSANRTGEPPLTTYSDALREFGDRVDVVLEGSGEMNGAPSTVVDLTSGEVKILREGAVSAVRIGEVL